MSMRFPLLTFALLASVRLVAAADFPEPYNSEKGGVAPPSPAEALASLKLPPGFKATMYAHEPEVQNPIGMAWDTRGRMWVAENYTYAERGVRFDLNLRDRVIILEDADGDGVAETRKVFTDEVQMLTSVEVGRGGVWLMCPPQLLFVPDANGDDVPDGPPEVVLDGFTVAKENYHNFANGLRWGPDGWLYGRCGASCPGEIGAPGSPASTRIPLRGGMWRYHPKTRVFEVLSHGTTNPWGHDWDEYGELFFVNTVNGHLWHELTGAHFVRPHTIDPNPNAYPQIDMHADHWHFDTGKGWQASRDGAANDLGGGHAHCGTMIYQGLEWPEQYRNKLFTLNLHGRRANVERLDRSGSGYMGRHEPDAFLWGDPWFRGIDIMQGPDGAAYVLDWSDTGECHDSTGVHRTSGRIYRIAYGDAQPPGPSVAAATPLELVFMLNDDNAWRARMAEQRVISILQTRGPGFSDVNRELYLFFEAKNERARLRAYLPFYAANGNTAAVTRIRANMLKDAGEHVRAWGVRLATQDWPLDTIYGTPPQEASIYDPKLVAELVQMGRGEGSALVRSVLASTLQRLPLASRAELASGLVSHAEDASDHDLPALVWYGLMPVAESDPAALVGVAEASQWNDEVRWIARRLAVASEKTPAAFDALLELAVRKPAEFQKSAVQGAAEGFRGWRKTAKPKSWDALAKSLQSTGDEGVQGVVRDLGTLFGDGRALEEVKRVALDEKAEIPARDVALRTLIESRPPELRQMCERLLETRYLNATAARGLGGFDDPKIGEVLVKGLKKFAPGDRVAVIETLVSRPAWALALLDEVEKGDIPRNEVSAFHARQMRDLGDEKVKARLSAVWGELRESAGDKKAAMAQWKAQLTPEALRNAQPAHGRVVFSQTCAVCHTLYGEGGKIGPDLTGGNRGNLDYLIENIVDPSAVVTAEFRMTLLTMKDGRVLSGMVTATNDRTLTLRTPTESSTIERGDIAKTETVAASMMPEGLLQSLPPENVRDLFAYLMSTRQVPLPAATP